MKKSYTCIVCPNGCEIVADFTEKVIVSLTGAGCKRGGEYVRQEITCPMRNITSSVGVLDGKLPLVSVKLSKPIPKEKIFAVMQEVRAIKIQAPVKLGQVILEKVLGLDSDVVATKNVEKI
jgi:CxxC motif-containing protein